MSSRLPSAFMAILDVGHGNAAVISTPAGTVVVDAGAGTALQEFLAQVGITKIDTLALSHADQDHIGAAVGLLASKTLAIDNVFLNTDSQKRSAVWQDLLYELQEAKARGQIVRFSPALAQDSPALLSPSDATIEVSAPCPYLASLGPGGQTKQKRTLTSNALSAVIRISTAAGPVALLLGDIDDLGLTYLKKFGGDLSAPLVVFPHHGGHIGTNPSRFTRSLMKLTKPSTVVFSIGRNRFMNPGSQITTAIKRTNPQCRILCTQLSVQCSPVSVETEQLQHLSCAFAAGREAGITCGGTIVIDLANARSITPRARQHRSFIDRCIPTPLCVTKPRRSRRKKSS